MFLFVRLLSPGGGLARSAWVRYALSLALVAGTIGLRASGELPPAWTNGAPVAQSDHDVLSAPESAPHRDCDSQVAKLADWWSGRRLGVALLALSRAALSHHFVLTDSLSPPC